MYLGSWRKGVIQHYLAKYSQLSPFIADTTVFELESVIQSTLALQTPRYNGHPDNTDSS